MYKRLPLSFSLHGGTDEVSGKPKIIHYYNTPENAMKHAEKNADSNVNVIFLYTFTDASTCSPYLTAPELMFISA